LTAPRGLPLAELVAVLVSEHAKMKDGLSRARGEILEGNFAGASEALAEVDSMFKQHIADEEGQILRLLFDVYGKKGAGDAIEVFRQHRPIYAMMKAVEGLSLLSPEELSTRGEELSKLLSEHAFAEESRVFQRALTAEGREADPSDTPVV
jgi:hypothetical protein